MTRPLVLIPGGSGYFGSLLLRKLLEQGARCRVFDLNDADDRPPEVEFIQGISVPTTPLHGRVRESMWYTAFPKNRRSFFR